MIRIILATLAVGTALLFALDAGSRMLTDNNAAARAFILSDLFWPAVGGFIVMALAMLLAIHSAYRFHPGRLSGRNRGGEG
ncbi:hypothetical protein [Novosphingobium sp.]|uniref:hypothetical protein n=1 Tax=Novosphingobium sp. TaxID=1874826 RepID=UPI0028AD1991|nr:hypothetical protein [Novosphingobium sp.]